MLKPQHKVVRISDDNQIALRLNFAPLHCPLVENVMQIDIGKQRRDHRSLRSTYLCLRPLPVFRYPGRQPLPDQPLYPRIRYPQLDQLHQLFMADVVEEALDIGIPNPVRLLRHDPLTTSAAAWHYLSGDKVTFAASPQGQANPAHRARCAPDRKS